MMHGHPIPGFPRFSKAQFFNVSEAEAKLMLPNRFFRNLLATVMYFFSKETAAASPVGEPFRPLILD
jgi:hypothetical protein